MRIATSTARSKWTQPIFRPNGGKSTLVPTDRPGDDGRVAGHTVSLATNTWGTACARFAVARRRAAASVEPAISRNVKRRAIEPPPHPGQILLRAYLRPRGIQQIELARHVGVTLPREPAQGLPTGVPGVLQRRAAAPEARSERTHPAPTRKSIRRRGARHARTRGPASYVPRRRMSQQDASQIFIREPRADSTRRHPLGLAPNARQGGPPSIGVAISTPYRSRHVVAISLADTASSTCASSH